MSSNSPLEETLLRIRPETFTKRLSPRKRSELLYLESGDDPLPRLLLDTTVYIDALQDRLPEKAFHLLEEGDPWHCTVTEAELAVAAGALDPTRPDRSRIVGQIGESIAARLSHRVLTPDRRTWRDAGVLAGLLARLQGYEKSDRRRALQDVLIYLTALENQCAVLTRNLAEFDFLLQLVPAGSVLFYDRL